MKKIKKTSDKLLLFLFGFVLVAFGIAIFVLPQENFSEKENRYLSTFPKIESREIVNGKYFEKLSGFYSDQFPMRDTFTSVHSLYKLALGSIEVNGVIPTREGSLIALPQSADPRGAKSNFEAIYSILDRNPSAYFYVPPRALDAHKNELPHAYGKAQNESILELLRDDTRSDFYEFLSSSEELYYKTDHHWNTHGAYLAYTQICEQMGIVPYPAEHFEKTSVSKEFMGTSYARSGLPRKLVSADEIILYRYDGDNDFTIAYHDKKTEQKGFYDCSALETSDKYRIFLGGNYPYISITNEESENKEKLLLIKDSFANSVIPFLAIHFDIEVIDPRYCSHAFLNEQLDRLDIDKTLFLIGPETLKEKFFN